MPFRRRVWAALHRTDQTVWRRERFRDCGNYVRVLRSIDDPGVFKLAGNYCHDRFCTPCARARASLLRENLTRLIGTQPIRFVTLTLRAEPTTLTARLDRLLRCFAALRKMPVWREHVTAGAYFLEAKYSPDHRSWHAHVHVIVTGSFLPQASLAEAWLHVTGDSRIVDIRRPTHANALSDYVTKYVTKALDPQTARHPDRLDELVRGLAGRRLATTIGGWRGVSLTAPVSDGEWAHVATFNELLDAVRRGDEIARSILDAVGVNCVDALAARRPAPTAQRPPPDVPTLKQLLLWDDLGNVYAAWDGDPPVECLRGPA